MRTIALLTLFVTATPLAADSLSDLRTQLQRYPAKAPFIVTATVQVTSSRQLPLDILPSAGGLFDRTKIRTKWPTTNSVPNTQNAILN